MKKLFITAMVVAMSMGMNAQNGRVYVRTSKKKRQGANACIFPMRSSTAIIPQRPRLAFLQVGVLLF